jgi:glycosyltransferase involved in cell wall biosynthesis
MSEPLVTVGLPVYNVERYVAQSLDTLLAQTFSDFKILICDNASTDRTAEICRDYASRDPRIEYHRNPTNLGMAGNYNRSFALSRSKYFRWAPADDYCSPDLLADHVKVLEADPTIALAYSQAWFVGEDGTPYELWKDELHLMDDDPVARFKGVIGRIKRVHHHLGLMRSDCVARTGGIAKHVSSDIAFVAEMSLLGKLYRIDRPQFFRRMHGDSSSWKTLDEEHQARRYHASNVNRIPFSRLRYHLYEMAVVRRSPALSPAQRAELFAFLARRAGAEWRWLAGEARQELLRALRPSRA